MQKSKGQGSKSNATPIRTIRLSERFTRQVERRRLQLARGGHRGGVVSWSEALRDMIRQAARRPKGPKPAA